jgi:hypothetical protein
MRGVQSQVLSLSVIAFSAAPVGLRAKEMNCGVNS